MEGFNIYHDIAKRTNGEIYIGVVGPVRTGKSTFIKRFMDRMVLPNLEKGYIKERTRDELPQSAAGKTIMTTEPKFVPNEAVSISLDDNTDCKVRLIDCVGYLIDGVNGHLDGDEPRMVSTPWYEEKIPFAQAAELGTKKVMTDHSTIGIVLTTDGSITDIPRENYEKAEEEIISSLKSLEKPFVVILNTTSPYSQETEVLKNELSEKYNSTIIPLNCAQLKSEDISSILENVLYEFPISEIRFNIPKWIEPLSNNHWLKESLIESVRLISEKINSIDNAKALIPQLLEENENIKKAYLSQTDLGSGAITVELSTKDNLFYDILSETTGMEITNEYALISTIRQLTKAKSQYDKIKFALEEVNKKGYGIVAPNIEDMELEKPEMHKQGSRYGIKIKATAPSIHMIRADINTEVSPIVGSEEQTNELITYLCGQYDANKDAVWNYTIFGRSMSELINDDLNTKLSRLPEDAQAKLQDSLQKILNEGKGGLICIIL